MTWPRSAHPADLVALHPRMNLTILPRRGSNVRPPVSALPKHTVQDSFNTSDAISQAGLDGMRPSGGLPQHFFARLGVGDWVLWAITRQAGTMEKLWVPILAPPTTLGIDLRVSGITGHFLSSAWAWLHSHDFAVLGLQIRPLGFAALNLLPHSGYHWKFSGFKPFPDCLLGGSYGRTYSSRYLSGTTFIALACRS